MFRRNLIGPSILALVVVLTSTTGSGILQSPRAFDPLRDSLTRDEPQAIYSADVADPWNRIFHLLFTRQIRSRLVAANASRVGMDHENLALSDRRVTRIESGDRAIDPLYPSWTWMGSSAFDMSPDSRWRILLEPRFSQFVTGLRQVAASAAERPPLARALMQADLWAVHDMFCTVPSMRPGSRGSTPDSVQRTRRIEELMPLLAGAIRSLALTRGEIDALPDNYLAGARAGELPPLFAAGSGWLELRSSHERMHERAADNRRVARVFVKPAHRPRSETEFLKGLEEGHGQGNSVGAAALVIQLLLIAADGAVVPSPITYEVQVRTAASDPGSASGVGHVRQHELSRRRLLSAPRQGGLVALDERAPAYLPTAGNDLSFATPSRMDGDPVLVALRDRCVVCHGPGLGKLITFSMVGSPRVEQLNAGAPSHARDVASRKMAREDFRSLRQGIAAGR